MANVVMSLASNTSCGSVVELSTSPFFHDHYSNLTKVLQDWQIEDKDFRLFIWPYLPPCRLFVGKICSSVPKSKEGASMKDKPFDVLRIQVLDAQTQKPVFERPMFIAVSGKRKNEITTNTMIFLILLLHITHGKSQNR
jgi:hypothetical protein